MTPRSWLPTALAALGVVVLALFALPFAVDDAFIAMRYADNLAGGGGWAMNPGSTSDGVTGPLWVLPLAAAEMLGLPMLVVARVVGVAAGAVAAALVVARVGRRAGGRRAAWASAILLAVAPQLAIWCVAGLETGLATLLAAVAALAATSRPRPRPWVLGVCVAALAALRPDLAFFALALLSVVLFRDRRAGRVAFALAAAGAVLVVGVRLWAFGDPLPLSFHAKPADVSLGASYAARGAMVITGVGGTALAVVGSIRGRSEDRGLALAALAHVGAVTLAGGDWMPGFRLLAPILPVYALLAGAAFTRPVRGAPARVGLGLCFFLALLVPGLDAWVQLPRAREAGRVRERDGAELATFLAARGESMALLDVGYLGLASGLEVVDLGGVTDRVVALSRGGHADKIIDVGYLAARDPDLVVLTSRQAPDVDEDGRVRLRGALSVEYRIAATEWLRNGYSVVHVAPYGDAHYVVLQKRP